MDTNWNRLHWTVQAGIITAGALLAAYTVIQIGGVIVFSDLPNDHYPTPSTWH